MGKYTPLAVYLQEIPLGQGRVALSFAEVEKIIGNELPPSAYKYRAWWANERIGTHVWAHAWLKAGWRVDSVDLGSQRVSFVRHGQMVPPPMRQISAKDFEAFARVKLSEHFGVLLRASEVPRVPKRFDMVSPDYRVVGDAKYLAMVRGERIPPAEFSLIAEHVWLLEKTAIAEKKFLVFGNDIRVPRLWLQKYGHLVDKVEFYFLDNNGELARLA